jgi:hypothetical protein
MKRLILTAIRTLMSDLSPKLREILSARHPGREPEVEKETEWMFFYKLGSKSGYKNIKILG